MNQWSNLYGLCDLKCPEALQQSVFNNCSPCGEFSSAATPEFSNGQYGKIYSQLSWTNTGKVRC